MALADRIESLQRPNVSQRKPLLLSERRGQRKQTGCEQRGFSPKVKNRRKKATDHVGKLPADRSGCLGYRGDLRRNRRDDLTVPGRHDSIIRLHEPKMVTSVIVNQLSAGGDDRKLLVLPPAKTGSTFMLQSDSMQPGLSDILLERASRYTPIPVEQTKLADRTIAVALDNVDFIEDPHPELALYSAMHRLVREDTLTGAKPAAKRDGQS